ncbi:hypothetical protein Ndes2526B_g04550 [Nannochloris sp. 'desiccata']
MSEQNESTVEAAVENLSVEDAAEAARKKADRDAKKAAKAAEKAAKEAAKEAAKAAEIARKLASITKADPDDPLRDNYGDAEMVQSKDVSDRHWTDVAALNPDLVGTQVLVRARVHTVRGKGKSAFLVLRQSTASVQVVMFVDEETKAAVNRMLKSTRQKIHVISRAGALPFEVTDAARGAHEVAEAAERGESYVTVSQDTRLDGRVVDLRTPANQAIFKVQSQVCQLFREALLSEGFLEIHTPKLLSGASEGGSAVFRTDYLGRPACLAQSPQFYKQMAICADMGKVFEIAPVFRAEKSDTHRHLCEFMGLDMEMTINESYHEVLDVLDRLFVTIFKGLETKCANELSVIGKQYPFEPLQYLEKSLRLTFAEGIKMLQDAGVEVDPLGDLNTEIERKLGKLVKEKYGTDFYMLHQYPLGIRPFYTMPSPTDPNYSNSFDIFIRGEEIISGAQRIHDPQLLLERANAHGIPVEQLQSYLDAFKYGAPPHGGAGVGLERVVMLFCGLDNIRKTSMFPRDPKRLSP